MTVKPIFVIRLHKNTDPDARISAFENLKRKMPDLFEQYHVVFASGENKHVEFECYNPDDIPEHIQKKTSGLILDIIANNKY